jgi:glucose-1-phosphate thymidylyltransferase
VEHPEFFDAVVADDDGSIQEIQVKRKGAASNWIWGAFKMPGTVLRELFDLWSQRCQSDEYIGTLVNAYLARGGKAMAVRAGESYVDIGTLHGYRAAITLLSTMGREEIERKRTGSGDYGRIIRPPLTATKGRTTVLTK